MWKGGQFKPIDWFGERLLWKKVQKKKKKNITSLKINKIIPNWKPFSTVNEWWPRSKDSRLISRNQFNLVHKIKIKENKSGKIKLLLNHITNLIIKLITHKATNKGHGLSCTIWKLWNIFINKYKLLNLQFKYIYFINNLL